MAETPPSEFKTKRFCIAVGVAILCAIAVTYDSQVAQVCGLVGATLAGAGYGLSRLRANAKSRDPK